MGAVLPHLHASFAGGSSIVTDHFVQSARGWGAESALTNDRWPVTAKRALAARPA